VSLQNGKWKKVVWSEYPESVNWDLVSEITGRIIEFNTISFPERDAECMILDLGDGVKCTVWNSVGLMPLFTLPVNSTVKIVNLGMKKSSVTNRAFRAFDIYVLTDK